MTVIIGEKPPPKTKRFNDENGLGSDVTMSFCLWCSKFMQLCNTGDVFFWQVGVCRYGSAHKLIICIF